LIEQGRIRGNKLGEDKASATLRSVHDSVGPRAPAKQKDTLLKTMSGAIGLHFSMNFAVPNAGEVEEKKKREKGGGGE